jgi:hypothetical protein
MGKQMWAAVTVAALALLGCDSAKTAGPLAAPATTGLVVHTESVFPIFRLDSVPGTIKLGQVFTVYALEQDSPGAAFKPCDSCFIDDKHIVHNGFDSTGTILNYVGGRQGWPTNPHLTLRAVRTGPDTIGLGKNNRELLVPVLVLSGSPPPPPPPPPPPGFPVCRLDSVPSSITVGQSFTVYASAQLKSGGPFVACDSCWINLRNTSNPVAAYVGGRQGWPTSPHLTIKAMKAGVDTLQMGKNNKDILVPITVH